MRMSPSMWAVGVILSSLLLLVSGQQCSPNTFYHINPAAPLSFTGFNRDIIVEDQPATIPSTVSATQGSGDGTGGATWFQGPGGLPFDLQTPMSGPPFQLSSPVGNNALFLQPIPIVTQSLPLSTNTFFTSLSIFGASQGDGTPLPVITMTLLGGGSYMSLPYTFQLGPWDDATSPPAGNTVALTQSHDFITTFNGGIDEMAGSRFVYRVDITITDTVAINELNFVIAGEQMAGFAMIMAVSGTSAQCVDCAATIPGCSSATCTSANDVVCSGCRDGFIYNNAANNCTGIRCGVPAELFRYRKLNIGTCALATTEQQCNLGCVEGYEVDSVEASVANCVATSINTVSLDWQLFDCHDINECSLFPPVCGDGWVCGNTVGSHTCTPLAPILSYIRECPLVDNKKKPSHRKRGHGEGEGDDDHDNNNNKQPIYPWEKQENGRYYDGEGEAEGTHDRIPKARTSSNWREESTASDLCIGLEWAALGAPHVVIRRAFLHVASSSRSWELDDIANPDYTTTVTVNGLKRGTTYAFTLVAETDDGVHRGLPFKMTTPSLGSIH